MQTILNFLRALWFVDEERIRVHWGVWLASLLVPFALAILILLVVFDYLTRDFPDRTVRWVVLLFLTLAFSVIALPGLLVVAAAHQFNEPEKKRKREPAITTEWLKEANRSAKAKREAELREFRE